MTSPYRADQVGSLLRPAALLEGRAAYAQGRIGLEELRSIEDKAILEALELQRQVGLDVFTDGEYRRVDFRSDFAEAVEGLIEMKGKLQWRGPQEGQVEPTLAWVAAGKLRQRRRLTAHETAFLKEHSPGPFKITIPAPSLLAFGSYKRGLTDQFYPTPSDLLWEIAGIIRGEIKAVVDEGVPYVQIDAPNYTFYVDERLRQWLQRRGFDPDRELDEAIAADNAALEGARESPHRGRVTVAIHLCRGNNRSHWLSEASYEPLAEKLFNALQVDRFLLEYDTERSGGFEPLRFMPRDKVVVLGLITTKEGRLESQDTLLRRIEEASKYIPIERLALSPQCGFATVAAGNLLSWDDQRRKLELLVDTARKVWG